MRFFSEKESKKCTQISILTLKLKSIIIYSNLTVLADRLANTREPVFSRGLRSFSRRLPVTAKLGPRPLERTGFYLWQK